MNRFLDKNELNNYLIIILQYLINLVYPYNYKIEFELINYILLLI